MKIWRLSAFPKGPGGGNKAGVVLDADALTKEEMQAIATEVGYSETAFVQSSTNADVRVRFFTPTSEVDLCGHATIATFHLLRDVKRLKCGIYTQETKAGILRLDVRDQMVYMEQASPRFLAVLKPADISLCFAEDDVVDLRYPIQVVSTGMKELFVPTRSVDQLHRLTPRMDAITTLCEQYDVIGIHVFAIADDVDAYGRNFAPVVGIPEESATGTSNGALSCYLYTHVGNQTSFVLRQGYSMRQPSEIHVTLETSNNDIQTVWVGGTATILQQE